MTENENFENDEIIIKDIDFEMLEKTISSLSKEIEDKKNSMTVEEKEIYESADRIIELNNKILNDRLETSKMLDTMSEDELKKYYSDVCLVAENYAKELNIESVTVEQINQEKLNDERDN